MFGTSYATDYKYCHEVGGDPYEMLNLPFGWYNKKQVESAYRSAARDGKYKHTDKSQEPKNSDPFIRLTRARDFIAGDPKDPNSRPSAAFLRYYNVRVAGERGSKAGQLLRARLRHIQTGTPYAQMFQKKKETPRQPDRTNGAPTQTRSESSRGSPKLKENKSPRPRQINDPKPVSPKNKKKKENADPKPVSPKKKEEEKKKKVKTLMKSVDAIVEELGVIKEKLRELEAD